MDGLPEGGNSFGDTLLDNTTLRLAHGPRSFVHGLSLVSDGRGPNGVQRHAAQRGTDKVFSMDTMWLFSCTFLSHLAMQWFLLLENVILRRKNS